ncbi:MAG: hypothetical protein IMX03_08405 [Brockia lithotrophica]|nr:hypothetical protein [Brockia lithotrophica]
MSAKFKPVVIKFLDYYPIFVAILSLVVSVANLVSENILEGTKTDNVVFSLIFALLTPVVAFAVSRAVKSELRREEERKKTEHWRVKFVKYFFGTTALLGMIYALAVWFDPTEPVMFDKALLSLINGVYGPAMAFVVYKGSRYILRVLWGIDDK